MHFYTQWVGRKGSVYNCTKKDKIPWNKFSTEVKDLFNENYKILMRRQRNERISYVHGLEEYYKMIILPKAFYRFSVVPIKTPMASSGK